LYFNLAIIFGISHQIYLVVKDSCNF